MNPEILNVGKDAESDPGTSLAARYFPEIIEDLSGKFKDVFGVILGYCNLCLVDEDADSLKENLERALSVAQRGTILAEQLSALSRLAEGYIMYSLSKGVENGRGRGGSQS